MSDCVICDIVAGRLPADIVYEDAEVIAFLPLVMDIYGHTVIAPKTHSADLRDTPGIVLARVMDCVQLLTHRYQGSLGASGFNLLHASGIAAQQSVPHLHVHLLPRYDGDGLNAWPLFSAVSYDKAKLMRRLHPEAQP